MPGLISPTFDPLFDFFCRVKLKINYSTLNSEEISNKINQNLPFGLPKPPLCFPIDPREECLQN